MLTIHNRFDQAFHLTFKQHESPPVILLKGDSGTGKTYIVSHLAQIYNVKVHSVTLGELAAENRGQLSKGFNRLIWKATTTSNSLILIEDLDLFFPRHGQESQDMSLLGILGTLVEQAKVMLIATTRRPDHIAFDVRHLFQDEIHLQIPTPDERFSMMRYIYDHYFQSNKTLNDNNIQLLSSKAHAFVAADIAQWCRLAEEDALNKNLDQGKSYLPKRKKPYELIDIYSS